jgi:hypothetical protein
MRPIDKLQPRESGMPDRRPQSRFSSTLAAAWVFRATAAPSSVTSWNGTWQGVPQPGCGRFCSTATIGTRVSMASAFASCRCRQANERTFLGGGRASIGFGDFQRRWPHRRLAGSRVSAHVLLGRRAQPGDRRAFDPQLAVFRRLLRRRADRVRPCHHGPRRVCLSCRRIRHSGLSPARSLESSDASDPCPSGSADSAVVFLGNSRCSRSLCTIRLRAGA